MTLHFKLCLGAFIFTSVLGNKTQERDFRLPSRCK